MASGGTAGTAGAFRDVQAKVDSMRTELEERQAHVGKLTKELATVQNRKDLSDKEQKNEQEKLRRERERGLVNDLRTTILEKCKPSSPPWDRT